MVEIRTVESKGDLRKFLRFPEDLYRNNPYYVPPMYSDEKMNLSRDKNPAFEYSEVKMFLAYKDGKVAGRVCGILHHPYNEKWNFSRVRFTRLDFIDDREVSGALMKALEDWARELGMTQVHGPLGFCDLDREGALIEGFDELSTLITIYNAPYYLAHMEAMGYVKDADWIEMMIKVPDDEAMQKIERIADMVKRRLGLRLLEAKSIRQIKPYFGKVFDLIDEAYRDLYGVVTLTRKQRELYIKMFLSFVQPELVKIVLNKDDEIVGFGLAVPSMSRASQRCRGRLFPFGWITVLRALKRYDLIDLYLVAVKPHLQGKGINAILIQEVAHTAQQRGVGYAESSPELEHNERVQAQWKFFETRQHKRRRCWVKDIV